MMLSRVTEGGEPERFRASETESDSEELLDQHRRNADLEKRLEAATAALAESQKELDSLLYSVSHDLRAPLRHIAGFARLVADDASPGLGEESLGYLEIVEDAAARMGHQFDAVLELSRLGKTDVTARAFDPRTLVADVRDECVPSGSARNIVWKLAELPVVQADPVLLRRVFSNLIDNAVKFSRMRLPAMIEVGAIADERDCTTLFVRDNGIGFDPRFADRLFGLFQRLHPSGQFEGIGLGLAQVRRIVARHQGAVFARGAIDGGATVGFSLPKPPRTLR
jgi:signal transduction histidine kinase